MMGKERFESWAWPAFGLLATTLTMLLLMGSRTGGELPVLAYLPGLFVVGGLSAAALLFALLWSLRRRPVLQRGRSWPLAALAASLWLCSLPFPYPSSHEGQPSPIRFRLPFDGEARVAYGGERRETNILLFDPAMCFGTCFEGGQQGLEVVAPAAGLVVSCEPARQGFRLVLEVAPDEYLALEGLVVAADGPKPGEKVEAGRPLGRAPTRLTAYLMDAPRPGRCEGIPMRYWGYLAADRVVEVGVPIPPQVVAHAAAEPSGSRGH